MMDKICILLVDDSLPFLNMTASFLSDHENLIVVGTAQNGNEALSLAAYLLPDVVLLDVNMPGLSGIETASRLCKILPKVGILVLSCENSDVYMEAAWLLEQTTLFQKILLLTHWYQPSREYSIEVSDLLASEKNTFLSKRFSSIVSEVSIKGNYGTNDSS